MFGQFREFSVACDLCLFGLTIRLNLRVSQGTLIGLILIAVLLCESRQTIRTRAIRPGLAVLRLAGLI